MTWYMYMCLPFGALFREIWYSDGGGGSSETKEPKLHKLGVFLANYSLLKAPSLVIFFFENGILLGAKFGKKIGIEIVRFPRSGRHIHIQFPLFKNTFVFIFCLY